MNEPRRGSGNGAETDHRENGMKSEQKRRLLIGRLLEHYGVLKEDAETQVDGWMAKAPFSEETDEPSDEEVDKST